MCKTLIAAPCSSKPHQSHTPSAGGFNPCVRRLAAPQPQHAVLRRDDDVIAVVELPLQQAQREGVQPLALDDAPEQAGTVSLYGDGPNRADIGPVPRGAHRLLQNDLPCRPVNDDAKVL